MKKLLAFFAIFLTFGFLYPFSVLATAPKDPKLNIQSTSYSARLIGQSVADGSTFEAEAVETVVFRFLNTGTVSWKNSGRGMISAYTMHPREGNSPFAASVWPSKKQTPPIIAPVKPGETAELSIPFKMPSKPGVYTASFHLAAENTTWVKGGFFFFTFKVVPATVKPPTESATPNTTSPSASNLSTTTSKYVGKKFMQNFTTMTLRGGDEAFVVLGFQNLRGEKWSKQAVVLKNSISLASTETALSPAHETWISRERINENLETVDVQGVLRREFYIRAPAKAGNYKFNMALEVDGELVPGTEAELNLTVTEDAPAHYIEPFRSVDSLSVVPTETPRLAAEPRIRVGIWKDPGEFVQFISREDDYRVLAGGRELGILPMGSLGVMKARSGGAYAFSGGGIDYEGEDYIRLEPVVNQRAIFQILNFNNIVSWKGPRAFNLYRGALELRRANDETLYAINDLLFEDYVKGIAENANGSPMEYLKSQSVAQRTYAYYVANFSDKHDSRNFDVVSHTGDQLYLGYESERIMPRFVEAAEATRGYMVTYQGEVAITPYFANTDGRTRAWTEVWGGSHKPWLVSVSAEYDRSRGTRLFGHGVGMSQIDASMRADKEGLDWRALLRYYYLNTDATLMYR